MGGKITRSRWLRLKYHGVQTSLSFHPLKDGRTPKIGDGIMSDPNDTNVACPAFGGRADPISFATSTRIRDYIPVN